MGGGMFLNRKSVNFTSAVVSRDNTRVFLGLNDRNKLFMNSEILAHDCTSFLVHDHYIIFTSLKHEAKFIPLNLDSGDIKKFVDDTVTDVLGFDERKRKVEQGSKIVTAIQDGMNLVLEMPRGNLETISPRALVLSKLRQLISNGAYGEAFIICRKHRIDMNILVDYDMTKFINNIESFVNQVQDQDYLCLFITGLKNVNVCQTLYKDPTEKQKSDQTHNVIPDEFDKVNIICKKLIETLKQSPQNYNQAIICAFCAENPSNHPEALKMISKLRIDDQKESESLMKYLIFLADVETLYNCSLELFDFELCVMVAGQSQKDPREYLPFLGMLKSFDENYKKFFILDHLKKFQKALPFLIAGWENAERKGNDPNTPICFEDVFEYAVSKSLYTTAIRHLRRGPEFNSMVAKYAEYEASKQAFSSSALCIGILIV
jgi:elongator complex protein 1